jgi:chromosome segregation ATPase
VHFTWNFTFGDLIVAFGLISTVARGFLRSHDKSEELERRVSASEESDERITDILESLKHEVEQVREWIPRHEARSTEDERRLQECATAIVSISGFREQLNRLENRLDSFFRNRTR